MGAPWQDHPAWKLLEQAEGALGEPLRSLVLDAPAEQLARTRDAQLAVLCTSLVAWEAMRPLADEIVAFAGHSLGQVTALVASGALDLEDGVRFAARPSRAHATRRRRTSRTDGRVARRDRRAGDRRVHRRARRMLDRQRQRARAGRDRGDAGRCRRRDRTGEGARRAARDRAERRWRVPHAAHGDRRGRDRVRARGRAVRAPGRARRREPRRRRRTRPTTPGLVCWRDRSAEHVTVARALAHVDGDACRARRRRVRRGGARLDDRRARQAHRSRRPRALLLDPVRPRPTSRRYSHRDRSPRHAQLAAAARSRSFARSPLAGETLTVPERMIVAPVVGIFRPHAARAKVTSCRPGTRSASSRVRARAARCSARSAARSWACSRTPASAFAPVNRSRGCASRDRAPRLADRLGHRGSRTAGCRTPISKRASTRTTTWIVERTGIRERRIAAPDETASTLGTAAAADAIKRAGSRPPTSTCSWSPPRPPTC